MVDSLPTPPWLWLNVLSLDAPCVALVWQDFVHRCYPSALSPAARLALGLTVWAIYLADRLIDTQHPAAENESARHTLYRQYSTTTKALLAIVVCADSLIALLWLRPSVLSSGLLPGAAVIGYLTVFARWRMGQTRYKQFCAAVLFTIGVFLVAWMQFTSPWRTLGWPAAAFFILCFGNLALIERWEHGPSNSRGWIAMLLVTLLAACLGRSQWYQGLAAGAIGLAILDFLNTTFSTTTMKEDLRRVLADAVLLVPLLLR